MKNKLKNLYIKERLCKVDKDFLHYEEDFIEDKDLSLIITLLASNSKVKLNNPNNSIILYAVGLTDEFDFEKARCNTIDGSPPDIDIDFDALDRHLAIEWVIKKWGRDNVANIITHGSFKPKSLARGYYRVTEKESKDLNELLKKIPQPKFGKEATLEEILNISPKIKQEERYKSFLNFANKTEDMVSTFGIHAAGVVISDFPIHDTVPMWKNSKADRITQFNKDEVEELGLIKFDFLSIDTLSIIKESVALIERSTGEKFDAFEIEDFNDKAYDLMKSGMLTGVFQMETSGKAKELIQKIDPRSIEEISDISALNRPGPMQAGLDKRYIKTKRNKTKPSNMPEVVGEILKDTQYTLIYQEQIMALLNKMAGFSLKEADDARRAMGKKKKEVLEKYKERFLEGSENNGIDRIFSEDLWDDIMGFADYCLHGETEIFTIEKGWIEIKEIVEKKLNYTVMSKDKKNFVFQRIQQFFEKKEKEMLEYELDNNALFKCTQDHKFLTSENQMEEIDFIFKKNLSI